MLSIATAKDHRIQEPSKQVPVGKIAILFPCVETVQVSSREVSATAAEAAYRMVPHFVDEGKRKFGWKVEVFKYDEVIEAERSILSDLSKVPTRSELASIASKLGANYIAYYTVQEFTGARTRGGLFGGRVTGRASITITVFDSSLGKLVWQKQLIATSRADEDSSMGKRMDLALHDAIRQGLDPFLVRGETASVASSSRNFVASVKKVMEDGASVLLDLGAGSNLSKGDIFVSLDGKTKIRILEVFQNGSTAQLIEGSLSEGQIFKSQD
jgi:hypothetical protein